MTRQLIQICLLALTSVAGLSAQTATNETETVRFQVLLSTSHEVSPLVGTDASGEATIEFILTRTDGAITSAIVDFHVDWRAGLPEELRAAHIHRAPAGVNGPVVVNTGLSPLPAMEGGTFFRQASVTSADGIAALEEILSNPAGFYLNVHSASNPGGLIRGQLKPDIQSQLAETEAKLQAALDDIDRLVRIIGRFPNKQ